MLLLQACKKDTVESQKLDAPLMEQAKTYFEKEVLTGKDKEAFPSTSGASKSLRQFLYKRAIWDKAYIKKISLGEAVIVPLRYNKTMYTKIGKNKQSVTLDYLSYLMIYKTPKGKMTAELVTWIPDDAYWDKRTDKNKSFSGRVIVENWQGEFIKGYSYDEKGAVRAIEIREPGWKGNQASMVSLECETTDWYS